MRKEIVLGCLYYWVTEAREQDYSDEPVDQLLVLALKRLNGALKAKLESEKNE